MSPQDDNRTATFEFVVEVCDAVASNAPPLADEDALQEHHAPSLFLIASRCRVTPTMAWYLRDVRRCLPDWIREAIAAQLAYYAQRNRDLIEDAVAVGAELASAGVEVAFRKGVHMSQLYVEPGVRQFNDMDILVRQEDLRALDSFVAHLGYGPVERTREQRMFLGIATNSGTGSVREGRSGPIILDAACGLLAPIMATRWADGRPITWDDIVVSTLPNGLTVLSPPYLLVDLAVNLYLNTTAMRYVNRLRFQRLTPYMDLALATRHLTDVEWQAFWSLVARFGLSRPVVFAFQSAERLFKSGEFARQLQAVETLDRKLFGQLRQVGDIIDEFGEFEFGEPQRWGIPLPARMLLEELPASVPAWRSPI